MTLYMGPNTGLLINGLPGEGHYNELIRMLRWDDFLRQPVVKGRVATLPTTGQAEGDTYIFTGAGSNQNRLARWWATGATTPIWEYMPPRLGWRVQVANETTPSGQVKTYEYSGSAWTELVGGMADAPSDGKPYARENGVWAELGSAAKSALNVLPFMNLMPDMGRFAGTAANPLSTMFTTSWTPSTFINGWNGASLADGGKFAFDNSTNGGAGPALNARVQALLAAMGRTWTSVSRYGVEFFTTVLTAGTQTTTGSAGADGVTRYLCCSNGSKQFSTRAHGRLSSCGCVSKAARLISPLRPIRPIAFGSMGLWPLRELCCRRASGCISGFRCSRITAMTTRARISTRPQGLRSRSPVRRGSVASSIRVSMLHPS
ncbi:hypothetical protein CSC27_2023 [Pseudomonas aeruginosa]|nr:hypothetical protein CSC27_2023 [Pseudomonas aeruginosa]